MSSQEIQAKIAKIEKVVKYVAKITNWFLSSLRSFPIMENDEPKKDSNTE